MSPKTPAAFMSYVHSDDKYKHLTIFRERLSDEVQVQTGSEFPIFQDRNDIEWGQNWRERIENSLDEVTFLIPIITPSFFNSKACREELKLFIEREKKLKRSDLILPVYYVDTPLMNDAELRAKDPLAEVIASRQYADWRELRFEPFTNPLVGKTLAQLAVQIRNALSRAHGSKKPPAKIASALSARPTTMTTGEGDEQSTESQTVKKEPPTRIVDPMYWGDYATISEAIKDVVPGTRILVRPGLYQESLVIDKPLEIIGDGEVRDIVIQAADAHVVKFQTTMGRLVNLTLRQTGGDKSYCVDIGQGRLELEDCDITSQSLVSVGIHDGADPRLRRNRIHDGKQGGVMVYKGGQGTLEDNDIFGNALPGVEIKTNSNPMLRRNRIHDTKRACGVLVQEGGQGTFEENDIFDNAFSGVEIRDSSNPTLSRNRIRDNKQTGVFVHDGGQGMLEGNDISHNNYSGLSSAREGNPVVRNNSINKNANFGVKVEESGGGTFENNDLTKNGKGAWSISDDSKEKVKRVQNKE